MKTINWCRGVGGGFFAVLMCVHSMGAESFPAREYLEAKGWTIGFAPGDRAVAEGLVSRTAAFEKRLGEIDAIKAELGAAELERRGGELAQKAAALSKLPAREADFRREMELATGAVKQLTVALRDVFYVHKIEIWRTTEVRQRLADGDKIEGFRWDEKAKRPSVDLRLNWQIRPDDYRLTTDIQMPPAIFVKLEDKGDVKAQVAAVGKDLEGWSEVVQQMQGQMTPLAVRLAMNMALGAVLKKECADEPASRWIREGLAGWLWREIVIQSVPTKVAGRYAVMIAQFPVARAGDKPINLEVWPEKEAGDFPLNATQVFVNIAEMDGAKALERLLEAFWQLPVEQRTSANLRRLYREQLKTGIEARAPQRSLGATS